VLTENFLATRCRPSRLVPLHSSPEILKIVTDVNNLPGSSGGTAAPASTPSSLVAGLKAHEPTAWRRLAFLYAPMVLRWCRRHGLQAADADDVLQEVFRTVVTRVGDFRREGPQHTFRGWLW